MSTPGSPTVVLALLSEEDRSMWSNVEVYRNGSRSHTPGGVGRKGRHHMYSGELRETSTYTSEQTSAFVIHS